MSNRGAAQRYYHNQKFIQELYIKNIHIKLNLQEKIIILERLKPPQKNLYIFTTNHNNNIVV